MNVLFHSNQICLRGTEVALYDYAHFNETILKNNSYVIYNKNNSWNEELAIQKFSRRYSDRVLCYENFDELDNLVKEKNIDICYFIKSGGNDGKLSKIKPNAVHAVFQEYEPHGSSYAYISEWLSNTMTGGKTPYVPHIVHLPKPTKTIREELGIPNDAFLFGRYGGVHEFDIDFVKKIVTEFVHDNSSVWFAFFNTLPFADHPRIKFFNGFSDLQTKANLIESCDAMIHARSRGESFGLAICEFLHGNKPVLAWNNGNDKHHIYLLQNTDCLYDDEQDLYKKITRLINKENNKFNYKSIVEKFSPELVINKFNDVFLQI